MDETEEDPSGVHLSREPTTEQEWLAALAPSGDVSGPVQSLLNRYLLLRQVHDVLSRSTEALSAALERVPFGMLVVARGRVAAANPEAHRLIEGSGLSLRDERLSASDPEVHADLMSAFERLERGDSERETAVIPDPQRVLNLAMTVDDSEVKSIVVALGEPDSNLSPDPEIFRQLFGLTPTESRVVGRLVLGMTSRAIAEELGVGVETVRTHVKHVLSKMGCHRQVDVVRKLLTSAAAIG